MNIIFIHRRFGRPVTLHLRPRYVVALILGMVVLTGSLAFAGYWLGSRQAVSVPLVSSGASKTADQMAAVTQRMADIQARMTRLDALGEHLAESNNLKGEEFDFRKKPMGGPLSGELSAVTDRSVFLLKMQELSREIDQKETQLTALGSVLSGRRDQPAVFLSTIPVKNGSVSSTFGYRSDPFSGRVAFHGGVDFTGPEGTDIYAVSAGIVTWAGEKTGYGNMVEINHGGGLYTRYAHARNVVVKVGDMVSAGQLVAYMGSTGRSTGPHLHYEVLRNGEQIDPATFIAQLRK